MDREVSGQWKILNSSALSATCFSACSAGNKNGLILNGILFSFRIRPYLPFKL